MFCANVTGSVLLLGFGIAGAEGIHVVGPLIAIAGFAAGALAGGRLALALGDDPRRFNTALGIEFGLVVAATVIALIADVRPEHQHAYLLIAMLVGAIIGALLFQVDLWLALAGAALSTAATLAVHMARAGQN